ncbi:MAG: L-histidine N(alpha)-methyltransferase [Syntrophobacterales bacterium]|jgi:L-histidine N-alpha-methyltransferase
MKLPCKLTQPIERLEILNCLEEDSSEDTGRDIVAGLSQPQKRLPSKYFYDAYGSWLFEQICGLPEYYLTRTEFGILEHMAPEIMAFFAQASGDLVELGSGSNRKIRILLDAANGFGLSRLRYVPVDISESALKEACAELLELFPELHIWGIIADFTRHLEVLPRRRKLLTFLGSTIGNFSSEERLGFLKKVAASMNPEDRLLLGLDMLKPADIIEAAYNDSQGVTAEFNKNMLRNLNRSFNADFNVADFEHQAVFVEEKERVEMHLRATRQTGARIADLDFNVACRPGETIRTEICQKFSREKANRDFKQAGLAATRWFTDPEGWFSLVVLKKAGGRDWHRLI